MDDVLKSSKSVEWYTPRWLVKALEDAFCPEGFTLDPCAPDALNAKAPKFYTPAEDGLAQSWAGERVFLNPPYGRAMPPWIAKAAREEGKHRTPTVALIPARTDTKAWHTWIEPRRKDGSLIVEFIEGRIRFGHPGYYTARGLWVPPDLEGLRTDPAGFPSAVIVWGAK